MTMVVTVAVANTDRSHRGRESNRFGYREAGERASDEEWLWFCTKDVTVSGGS